MTTAARPIVLDDIATPTRAATRWWLIPVVALAALVLLLGVTAVVVAWRVRQSHQAAVVAVEAEVARARAAGEPITTADLYAYHRAPSDARDITRYWLDALASFEEKQFIADAKGLPMAGDGDKEQLRPTAADSQFGQAEAFLQKYDATFQAALLAAGQEGECRYRVQFEKGISLMLPHAQKLRYLITILALRARVEALRGDTDAAIESVEVMLAASSTLDQQLTLVEHLIRVATHSRALEEIQWLLNETQLTDAHLARLSAMLQASELQAGLTTGLFGERAYSYHTFHHLSTLGDDALPLPPGASNALTFVWGTDGQLSRPADCLKSMEFLGQWIEASREPFPAAEQRAEQVEIGLQKIVGSSNPLDRFNHMITALMMPAIQSAFDTTARGLARRDATIATLATERFRLKTGSFPARLNDLYPEFLPTIPIDPFDGQPLRMIQTSGELVIYSVGRDKKDGGGLEGTAPGQPDVVVRVKAVKQATAK